MEKRERGRKEGRDGGREGEREGEREGGREGLSRFSVKYLMAHSTKKIVAEPFCASQNFWPKRGISQTPMENLLSHSTKSFRRGILLCFRKFRVSKKKYRRAEYHDYTSKICCLTVPKNFLGEPVSV